MMNRFIVLQTQKCIGWQATCEVALLVSHQEQETGIETVVKDEFLSRYSWMKGYIHQYGGCLPSGEDAPCNVRPNGAYQP